MGRSRLMEKQRAKVEARRAKLKMAKKKPAAKPAPKASKKDVDRFDWWSRYLYT